MFKQQKIIEGIYYRTTKNINSKPTASIIPNWRKLQAFPVKYGKSQLCQYHHFY
jgi:hypothetical protein